MDKKRFYFITLILVALTLVGAGCLDNKTETNTTGEVKRETTVTEVAEINVDLIIDTGDNKESYTVTAKENAKVIDILRYADDENNLSLEIEESSFGQFVQGLAGKTGGTDGKYWLYYVNGESATVGVAEQVIKDGDKIEFRFE